MHEFGTKFPTANMTYTRSQTYTNMVVSGHGTQAFEVVVVKVEVVVFDVFVPHKCTSPIIFGQVICPNMYILNCQIDRFDYGKSVGR
jgi:hypothetical protein